MMSWEPLTEAINEITSKLPQPKTLPMKKSIVVAASVSGLFALIVSAIYFRRKRQKSCPKDDEIEALLTSKRHRKLKNYSSTASSPNSVKTYRRWRHRRRRNTSTSTSVDSSTVSSLNLGRNFTTNENDLKEIEKLYQEGIDSFENAFHQWDQATCLLQNTSKERTQLNSSIPAISTCQKLQFYSQQGNMLKEDRIRSFSFNYRSSPRDSSIERSKSFSETSSHKKLNNNDYSQSESHLDYEMDTTLSFRPDGLETSFDEQLQSIVEHAKKLQDVFESVLYEDSDSGDTDMTLTGYNDEAQHSDDSESNESFVSARESWDTRSIESSHSSRRLFLYEEALEAVDRGDVSCRTYRSDLLDCYSDDEFLAKLHCVRQAVDVMLQDVSVRNWLIETGRLMIECILCSAERSIDEFQNSFARMIDYINNNENWNQIETELKGRKVVKMTFYDIVLDFLIMDAFEDLEHPPGPVVSIMNNRWLATSLKESALTAAVWGVLKAKKGRLAEPNGFVGHLYSISEHVSPVLAWGFLGSDGRLKEICTRFKDEVISFLQGLFSFDQIRYTNTQQMADDILNLTRERFGVLLHFLQNSKLKNNALLLNGDIGF